MPTDSCCEWPEAVRIRREEVVGSGWRPDDGDVGGVLVDQHSWRGPGGVGACVELGLSRVPDEAVGLLATDAPAV